MSFRPALFGFTLTRGSKGVGGGGGERGAGYFPKKNTCPAKNGLKKSCKGSVHGENVEQVLSTIQVLCSILKTFLAQAINIVHQRRPAQK